MTARVARRLGTFLRVAPNSPIKHLLLLLILSVVILCGMPLTDSFAQPVRAGDTPQREEGGVTAGKSSAVIGDSGYVVTIPEVQMRNILGKQPVKTPPTEEPPPNPEPTPEKTHSKEPDDTPRNVPVRRLPFDPVDENSAVDTPGGQPPAESSPSLEEPPGKATLEPTPAEPPAEKEFSEKDAEPHSAKPPVHPPESVESPVEESPNKSAAEPAVESSPDKESSENDSKPPWLYPPVAPEEIGEKPVEAKLEIFPKKIVPRIPAVIESELSKELIKPMAVERYPVEQLNDPSEWLALDSRRDPEIVIPIEAEPEPEPEPQPESFPAAKPEPAPERRPGETVHPAPEPQPMQPPEPREIAPRETKKEPSPEKEEPKETIPSPEKTAPPAKEHFPSPLDEDLLDSRQVKTYLKETAPILEELSLLMTRSPGLTIEDYDPSDANASIIPREILLKMNAIKRELQVLDAKTFAVIPPPKYSQFHSLIRQSITEAHEACNSIIDYFQESKIENFQKAREHLLKAGEFIRRTRPRPDRG